MATRMQKRFPGQTLESQTGALVAGEFVQGQSSQALQQTPHPSLLVQHKWCSRQCRPVEAPRDCCSVEGVVLQLVYLEQTGGSVQHIICFPHTFRMQAHEGQHISAVKPP